MYMIPKNEFMAILDSVCAELVSIDACTQILEYYGDEYYREYGSEMELTVKNKKRKDLFRNGQASEKEGNSQAEEAINILEPIRRSAAETSTGGFEQRPIVKALQLAIETLEKQIPKKPIADESDVLYCPVCKECIETADGDCFKYCPNCSQRIDWTEGDAE